MCIYTWFNGMLIFLILFFLSRVSFLSFSAGCHKMWGFFNVSGLPPCRQKWVLFQSCCIQQLPQILCGIFGYRSFWGEFLVLLKGVAKFLNDFTGEEPRFYLQFFRPSLRWFMAEAFWEQIQVSWSDLTTPEENWCRSAQHRQKNQWNGTASCRALLFFSGWDTPLRDSVHL